MEDECKRGYAAGPKDEVSSYLVDYHNVVVMATIKKAPLHDKLGVLTILGDQWRRMQWGQITKYHNVAGVTTDKLKETT